MLDKKKYFKILGIIVFTSSMLYTINTASYKLQYNNKVETENQVQQTSVNQSEALKLTGNLDKSKEDIKLKDPEIIVYTVKASDTIESIANTYGLKTSAVIESNKSIDTSRLSEGTSLVFPSIDGIAYKIQGGETLWDLANLYKITVEDILAVNKLENPDKLKLNQYIIIPKADKALQLPSKENKSTQKSKKTVSLNRGIWPTSGSITSKFGPRWGRKHEGIDIAASTGTNVYAFMEGKVVFSGWQSGYGKLIIIDHGNGLKSYYGHNSKLLAKVGQTVSKGTHISEIGSTGNSTGPHLHFEIRKNGTPVNPYTYLR